MIFTGPGVLDGGDVMDRVPLEPSDAVPRAAPYQTSGVIENALPKPPEVVPPPIEPKYGSMCCMKKGVPGCAEE